MDRFSLSGKTVLITGASSGIGSACCRICAESGADVILLGRDQERLKRTREGLNKGDHSALSIDLLNIGEIEKSLRETLEKHGKINGFIHSAGIDISRPLNSFRLNDYYTLFNTNVISGFEIAKLISREKFCPAEGASYIFISSVMGLTGAAAKIGYSSSKGALIAGCRSMALELAPKKIRVNCISPAIVMTELVTKLFSVLSEEAVSDIKSRHPLGYGIPDDIAYSCLYLLSDEARWITGTNLVIDGGYSCQ
jgi:NAD(P)-dependent dehydrogenase (short-subunit alcohol dehydrogenase family)